MTLTHLLPWLYVSEATKETIDMLFGIVDWVVHDDRVDLLDDLLEIAEPGRMPLAYAIILLACPGVRGLKGRALFVERLLAAAEERETKDLVQASLRLLDDEQGAA